MRILYIADPSVIGQMKLGSIRMEFASTEGIGRVAGRATWS